MAIEQPQIDAFKDLFTAQLITKGSEWGKAAIARWTATMAHPSFKDIQSEKNNVETPENLTMQIKAAGEVMANVEVVPEGQPIPVAQPDPVPVPEPMPTTTTTPPVADATSKPSTTDAGKTT